MLLLSAFCNIQTINNSAKEDILPMGYDEAQNENIKETTANSMLGADVSFLRDMNVDANEIMNQRQALLMTASEGIILTADVEEKDNGRVKLKLDWSTYEAENKTFRIYQKVGENGEWESTSTVDLTKEDIEPVKVLNVYPLKRKENTQVTYTYEDGSTKTLPKSAGLKIWMEGGSIRDGESETTFEAYGKDPNTGKQIIQVTQISYEDFNKNPEQINSYDVVAFGFFDGTSEKADQPDDNAVKILEEYIKKGYGVLVGHDEMGLGRGIYGLNRLRSYFNIKIGYQGYEKVDESKLEGVDYKGHWAYGSSIIEIKRDVLPTNFLYSIPVGKKLGIDWTHTNSTAAIGNAWVELVDGNFSGETGGEIAEEITSYYLTTYNNTAKTELTHAGKVTEEEAKILANTILYLKQRTKEKSVTYSNYLLDSIAPSLPEIQIDKNLTNDNKIRITYNSQDSSEKYSFKVQAYDESDEITPVVTSNEISKTISTGVKGFYYIIDSLPEHDFDVNNANYEETGKLELGLEYQGQYIHIKAVDKAGNISEVSNKLINIYDNITITTDWQDENNKYNVRPETIIMKLYRKHSQNEQGEHVGDYEAKVDKNRRVQVYTLKNMLVEDNDGKYEYYIEKDKNLQHYETNIEGLRITNTYTGPTISSNLTIQGKEKIKTKDEAVNYSINYTVQIGRYEGNAIVIITNILPYELDEQKTDMQNGLDGGEYNKDQKTITWTIRETDINNLKEEGVKTISIQKNIAVVYSNIDTNKTNFTNEVKGRVQLETGNIILEKDKEICATNTQFIKNIKVTKTWNHGSNKYERPTKITLQVKDGERIVAQYTIGQDDNWTHTFENLPKYRENGEEIEYTVDEEAIEGESLKYYRKNIN